MPRERQRHGGSALGPDPFSDDFATTTAAPPAGVQVVHGLFSHTLPLGGMTVRAARQELAERMNIAPDALAVVNGNVADEDTVIGEGAVLTFATRAGEKG